MICPNCKSVIDDDSKFCCVCGASVEVSVPENNDILVGEERENDGDTTVLKPSETISEATAQYETRIDGEMEQKLKKLIEIRKAISEMNNYSREIADVINDTLMDMHLHYTFHEETGNFEFVSGTRGMLKTFRFIITVKASDYTVYCIAPVAADSGDAKMLSSMAEFVCRANYGLKNGNFEFDMSDGEIRYKSYVDCENELPETEVIKRSIIIPQAMFQKYDKGIAAILFAGATSKEAISKCEML